MSRKKHSVLLTNKPVFGQRSIRPDYKYNSILLQRFINNLMWDGKLNLVQKAVYQALESICHKSEFAKGKSPSQVIEEIIGLVTPDVLVISKRVGGSNYQIPVLTNTTPYMQVRAVSKAIKWLVNAIRSRKAQALPEKIYAEIEDVYNGRGGALSQKENIRKIAESNKAFTHLYNSGNANRNQSNLNPNVEKLLSNKPIVNDIIVTE
jgi:small subunit ribosomal protein S7